jgi:ferredoxin
MKPGNVRTALRSWIGVVAAAVVLVSAAWLAAEYAHAVRVASPEKALVESLKERARTDPTVHKALLQPEFDRQREALERRVTAYRRAGLLLLVSLGSFIAWSNWLKPRPGEWVGVPATVGRLIEALVEDGAERLAALKALPKRKVKKEAPAGSRPKVADRSQVHYRVLDSCSGCTICAQVCPLNAIEARPYLKHEVIDGKCTRCGLCVPACPEHAIEVVEPGRSVTAQPTRME